LRGRSRIAASLLALCACAAAGAAQQHSPAGAEACATLAECIAGVRNPPARPPGGGTDGMREQIRRFGDEAVDALVPMLLDPDRALRQRAGYLLSGFERIDPRQLPALVQAWRHGEADGPGTGNGWLPRAIAATGTAEALRLLWADYLRDPDIGSNSQVFGALARFPREMMEPLVAARFEQCRADASGGACTGLFALLHEIEAPLPAWSREAVASLAAGAASDETRWIAERALVALRDPRGLAAYRQRLERAEGDGEQGDGWHRAWLIESIGSYGVEASAAAPLVARALAGSRDERVRASAALALGRLGDPAAAPALLAAAGIEEDWLLAYNVAESLGRLRAADARPFLERLAAGYWHQGVRNNAKRALNAIAGRGFSLSGDGGDDAERASLPDPEAEEGSAAAESGRIELGYLRHPDDRPSRCFMLGEDERTQPMPSDEAGVPAWPVRGIEQLRFVAVAPAVRDSVRRRISVREVQGIVRFAVPARDGRLVALDGGEFGGGLYHLPRTGSARPLFEEPVAALWRMNGRIYVAAGLSHLVLDFGHLYEIDPVRLAVTRRIRLPAAPTGIGAAAGRAIVVETARGDLGIRADGRLVDVASISACG
jgi:hypothetical protein